jgi:GntR family transcriptional regulator
MSVMPEPKYRTIAASLRQEIESESLQAGEQLPTEAELAALWRASRSTVREAIAALTDLGLVEARAGQGTFVRQKMVPFVTDLSEGTARVGTSDSDLYFTEVRKQGRLPDSTDPRVEIHAAKPTVAAALGLAPGSQVVSRHQQRFIDSRPYSLQTSFYSMDLATRGGADRIIMAEDITEGTAQYLRDTLGIEQVGYRDVITVRKPDLNEITFFKLPEDGRIPVFENFRTTYDQHGNPIRISVTVYPTDRNHFVINVPSPGMEFAVGRPEAEPTFGDARADDL